MYTFDIFICKISEAWRSIEIVSCDFFRHQTCKKYRMLSIGKFKKEIKQSNFKKKDEKKTIKRKR